MWENSPCVVFAALDCGPSMLHFLLPLSYQNFLLLFYFVAERNWNMTLPGFGGDEIKSFRKPVRIFIDQLPSS